MSDLWTEKFKHVHRILGLSQGMGEEIAAALEGALEKLSGKIIALDQKAEKTNSLLTKKKYLDLQKVEIHKVLRETYADIGETVKAQTIELAQATPGIIDKVIKSAGITVKMGVPNLSKARVTSWFGSSQIEGLYFNEWMKKLSETAAARVIKETRDGLLLHETPKEVGKRISKALEVGQMSAEGMAHNGIFQASNWAEMQFYQSNSKIIQKVRFVAELDRQTTPLCISLSGKVFSLYDAPQPPLHWRCRSSLAPIFKSKALNKVADEDKIPSRLETEARTIKHRDGTTSTTYDKLKVNFVSAKTTHNQWMQGLINSTDPRDLKFAREALGPTRFKLVKSGKLRVDQFYYHGKLRTIKELEALI
jgi:SPP1 gp7 family putative phage head morphogenesis protein